MTSQDILDKRIRAYLQTLPPAISGEHGHNTTFHVASILVWGFALPENEALYFFFEYNTRCEPPWPEKELRRKLRQAANPTNQKYSQGYLLGDQTVPAGFDRRRLLTLPTPPPRPVYRPEKLAALAARISYDISPAYLESRSKFTCWNRSPAGVLHKLYQPGECVVVFNVFESQGCGVWTHPGNTGHIGGLDYLQKNQKFGVWFLANPTDGQYHWNPRQEKDSRRSEESITCWRYMVIESDHVPADLWLKALVQMPLRISAIYMSGGRSVHALVRIDASSKAEWDAIVRGEMSKALIPLGACEGAMTAVRLTRLPNCRREETEQMQSLLYLNDDPPPVPIVQLPIREAPTEDRSRWTATSVKPEPLDDVA